MRRCVIIGGADIGRYDRIRAYLRADDFYICCDSGLKHREVPQPNSTYMTVECYKSA